MVEATTVDSAVSGLVQSSWTQLLPNQVRSWGRPLLQTWRRAYRASREKLRETLTAPGVTSYLMGGCANQIFQYATGLALARRLGVKLKLDVSWFETATPNQPRKYSLGLFKGVDAQVVDRLVGQVIHEEEFPYKPELFQNAPRKCSLVGYWQCEKYFFGLRDELRERLLPREALPAGLKETEGAILEAGERSVLVHVRRTDYVGNPYHVVLPMEYYREAAALIADKATEPIFFVFSDDPRWCEENFKLPHATVLVRDNYRTTEQRLGREDADLFLMRLCNHAIIANSSYSWWGAWLGADITGGMVVAPKNWFGPACEYDARDIVPERWLRL